MNVALRLKARVVNRGLMTETPEWSATLINDGRVVGRTHYVSTSTEASLLGRERATREGWTIINL